MIDASSDEWIDGLYGKGSPEAQKAKLIRDETVRAVMEKCPNVVGFGPIPSGPGCLVMDGSGRWGFDAWDGRGWRFGRIK